MARMVTREEWTECRRTRRWVIGIVVTAFVVVLSSLGALYRHIDTTATHHAAQLAEVRIEVARLTQRIDTMQRLLERRESKSLSMIGKEH